MKRLIMLTLAIFTMLTACTLPSGISVEESSEVSEISEPSVPDMVSYEEYVPPIIVSAKKVLDNSGNLYPVWEVTTETGEIISAYGKWTKGTKAIILRFFPYLNTAQRADIESDTGDFVEAVIDYKGDIIRQFEKRAYKVYRIKNKKYTKTSFLIKHWRNTVY